MEVSNAAQPQESSQGLAAAQPREASSTSLKGYLSHLTQGDILSLGKMLCSQAEGKGCREPGQAGQEAAPGGSTEPVWCGPERGCQSPGHLPHNPQGNPQNPLQPCCRARYSLTHYLTRSYIKSLPICVGDCCVLPCRCEFALEPLQLCGRPPKHHCGTLLILV